MNHTELFLTLIITSWFWIPQGLKMDPQKYSIVVLSFMTQKTLLRSCQASLFTYSDGS